jgi:hypothetical protein
MQALAPEIPLVFGGKNLKAGFDLLYFGTGS